MNQIFRTCVFNRNIYKSFEISKRFAGHSKWQNIKHTKAENDSARAILFLRLRNMIREAVSGIYYIFLSFVSFFFF